MSLRSTRARRQSPKSWQPSLRLGIFRTGTPTSIAVDLRYNGHHVLAIPRLIARLDMSHWIVRHIAYMDKDHPCGHYDNAEDAIEHFNLQYVEETGGVLTTKENTAPCLEYFLQEQKEETSGLRDVGKSVRLFWGM